MIDYGYSEIYDFIFYPVESPKLVGLSKDYKDDLGNTITGSNSHINILINGVGNSIFIDKDIKISGAVNIVCSGNENEIVISKGTIWNGNNNIHLRSDQNVLSIGNSCKFTEINFEVNGEAKIIINDSVTFASHCVFYTHVYSIIEIGKDCMFSFDVIVQTGDGHSIFDIKTGKNINSNKKNERKKCAL